MNFALDSETRRRLGYKLIDHIDAFYSSLPDRKVQLPAPQRTFGTLDDALPELGDDAAGVLDDLCRDMIDKGFHVPSPNYFGLMNPTPTYMGVLAEALVAALNPQLATLARSQLASKIEMETVRWIAERVGWSKEFGGTFTSGGNEANFSGLALALAAKFPQAVEDGVSVIGGPAVIYASAESHHSLDKSAGLLGVGRRALRRIEVNQKLQLDVEQLENAIRGDSAAGKKPFCVVATAGTTNSGVVDDLTRLAGICRRLGLWLHVDGAYGAAAVFSDKYRNLVQGIELADSITIDPHKWLAVPFAAGVILTRHPRLLEQTFSVASPYMPKDRAALLPDNARISTQWTRRMNSLKLWLTLRVHGRQAYEEHFDRQMKLAAKFVQWLTTSADYEPALKPTFPIVNFKLRGDIPAEELMAAHARVVEQVTEDGSRWISETRVNGCTVLRMMIISYLTEERHLQALQESLTRAAKSRLKP
jgi:glutamate/tyrosine decarboxylase-like PLP-dependent enzyme